MKTVRTVPALRRILQSLSSERRSVGFVPTMGALHEGHLSLVRRARKENDLVVVSIFVNPLQFGPNEDFHRYPRPLRQDLRLCRGAGVDIVFLPSAETFYAKDHSTFVTVERLSGTLCGAFRPDHFRGVATVVTKLFNAVGPCHAYFGMKDLQQSVIIRRMVRDLDIPVRITVCPTVREKDGLALSSRNTYLSAEERRRALTLSRSLFHIRDLVRRGVKDLATLRKELRATLSKGLDPEQDRIDYADIVDRETLEFPKTFRRGLSGVVAVRVGSTRLIDNLPLS